MFAHWIALDPGSNSLRLYDYFNDREVCLKTCIAYDKQKMIALAEQALAYVYQNKKDIKVRYPIKQGDILNDVTPLIRQALKELKVSQNVFKPCFLVCLNEDVSDEQKLKWQQQLAACKVRKVEFITPMEVLQTEQACFIIHAGHSYTEMGIYAHGHEFAHKIIYFGGMGMDEKIKMTIAQKQNCLISNEDASDLKEAVSQAFKMNKNPMLQCMAMDRYGKLVNIQIRASDLWPAMEEQILQVVLWAKHCYMNMGSEMKQRLMNNGIMLSGGLANCFGLKEALKHEFDCPIICTTKPECDIIEQMKGLK